MPVEFRSALDPIRKEFETYHKSPMAPILHSWNMFWEIRSSKAYESPVTHTDILASAQLYGFTYHHWEIKLILHWDRLYYSCKKD